MARIVAQLRRFAALPFAIVAGGAAGVFLLSLRAANLVDGRR